QDPDDQHLARRYRHPCRLEATSGAFRIMGNELDDGLPLAAHPLDRFDVDPGVAQKGAESGQRARHVFEDHSEFDGHLRRLFVATAGTAAGAALRYQAIPPSGEHLSISHATSGVSLHRPGRPQTGTVAARGDANQPARVAPPAHATTDIDEGAPGLGTAHGGVEGHEALAPEDGRDHDDGEGDSDRHLCHGLSLPERSSSTSVTHARTGGAPAAPTSGTCPASVSAS